MSNENPILDEHEKLISKKSIYYKFCNVHITLKKINPLNGKREWENGYIKEANADHLILQLSAEGMLKNKISELPIFFLEIEDIEEYQEAGA